MRNSTTHQTSKPSRKEGTGIDRLVKYIGAKRVSFYYKHKDGTNETLAFAPLGDRIAIKEAEIIAKRKALDIQAGKIVAGSVAKLIERFKTEEDPTHYIDQSKVGKAVRNRAYATLTAFFGTMDPKKLKTIHCYQFVDARSKEGAPAKAWKELYTFSTICKKAIRWGVMEHNPIVGMVEDPRDKDVRTINRRQVIKFYLWSSRQKNAMYKTLGCAALFGYLTGFRAAEIRPFHITGLTPDGPLVLSAKRKKGEPPVEKLREWSPRLRMVVARAKQAHGHTRIYLFANGTGSAYTGSGWASVWQDAMWDWIASFDDVAAKTLKERREWDAKRRRDKTIPPFDSDFSLVDHPMYFALSDPRPAAITKKLEKREADAYDFAAHANPTTTHTHYDRRKVKRARATE